MKIAVLGAGAQGSMFGGFLSRKVKETWLVDIWKEHIEAIKKDGLLMTKGQNREIAKPGATTNPEEVGPVDLIIVQVKGFDTEQAIRDAVPMISRETYVMTLQNGIGNAEKIARVVAEDKIIVGVTTIGSAVVGPGHIELTDTAYEGRGGTDFGFWKHQENPIIEKFHDIFTQSGILTRTPENINEIIYYKLAMASGMAALTGIGRLYVNQVIEHQEGIELLQGITREVVNVANAKGIRIEFDEAMERGMASFRGATGHITSMCSDILTGRKTELDTLNGAVVSEGKRLGVPTPVNETITRLVKLIEKNRGEQILTGVGRRS